MHNKIIALSLVMAIASANTNILIKNTTAFLAVFNDVTTNTKCPIAQNSATSIIVNSDYSLSCINKVTGDEDNEITHPLPHNITLTKDGYLISGCITNLPKNDILIYIQNAGTSAKPKLICKNFPPA